MGANTIPDATTVSCERLYINITPASYKSEGYTIAPINSNDKQRPGVPSGPPCGNATIELLLTSLGSVMVTLSTPAAALAAACIEAAIFCANGESWAR